MSYEKQTWNTGDIITADKLNHMEDGIGSVVIAHIIPTLDGSTSTVKFRCDDYTASELAEFIDAGKMVLFELEDYIGVRKANIRSSSDEVEIQGGGFGLNGLANNDFCYWEVLYTDQSMTVDFYNIATFPSVEG